LVRAYYPRTYEVTYLLGILAGILSQSNTIGYAATNPIYGVPAALNAFAQGAMTVRPKARILLRWACLNDPNQPLDFSDRPDVRVFYAHDRREPSDTYRDYGLCLRLSDGTLKPLALPIWRWDVFYVEIVRSIFDGTWDSGASGRAINYWWGLKSGAESIAYPFDLPSGTLQLLATMERQLLDGALHIFPATAYSQGHLRHSPQADRYTPGELIAMDWLDECVDGSLPRFDQLDVRTHALVEINGLDRLKKGLRE